MSENYKIIKVNMIDRYAAGNSL